HITPAQFLSICNLLCHLQQMILIPPSYHWKKMTGQGTRPHVPHRYPASSSPHNNLLSSSSSASSSSLLSTDPACPFSVSFFNFCSLSANHSGIPSLCTEPPERPDRIPRCFWNCMSAASAASTVRTPFFRQSNKIALT